MKKLLFISLITIILCVGCGKKEETQDNSEISDTSQVVTTQNLDENSQDDNSDNSTDTVTTVKTDSTENETTVTTTVTTIETTVENSEQTSDKYESSVETPDMKDEPSDAELLSVGQELYEQACDTEFKFFVGTPYDIDCTQFITNQYSWEFYLVTESGYNSIADVENDYFKVFWNENGSDLSEVYMEQDGKLYALDGARGKNIFYDSSKVVAITEKSDSAITFSVEDYYNGDDFDPNKKVTKTRTFSIAIDSENNWRVDQFYLPY